MYVNFVYSPLVNQPHLLINDTQENKQDPKLALFEFVLWKGGR
jgi:hypothetical protein